jgi:hypothetical protein
MKAIRSVVIPVMLALSIVLTACNFSTTNAGGDALATAAAETVSAQLTQIVIIPPSETPVVATDTPPVPTETPTETLVPSPTPVPATATATPIPCDWAGFVSDVTIPDNTEIMVGQTFTKTWRLKNIGTCTWSTSYKLVFMSGDSMNAPATKALSSSVAPGKTIDVSANLKAPSSTGTYQGNFMLQNASGVNFGLGGSANSTFWVKIKAVKFTVTKVTASASPKTYTGACSPSTTFTFTGKITANGPGTVTYKWERSDNASSSEDTVTFSEAGTKTVTTTWTFGGSGNVGTSWERLHVTDPNDIKSSKAEVQYTCP